MRLTSISLIVMLFMCNVAFAQDYIALAVSKKEAADIAAQKSYTKKNAFLGYLDCYRLYQKAGNKYHSERAQMLTATSSLLTNEQSLMKRDAVVVDSLLIEAYDEFKDDIINYLPLLEQYVCKSNGAEDKYYHSFEMYDKAIAIRKKNDLQKGNEYETILRWYVSKLFYKKNISKEEKFNIYTELWNVYLANNPTIEELDIKLLDNYHSSCGFEGHEDVAVILSEQKKKYVTAHSGKDSKEYLDILHRLSSDYYSLAKKEEIQGIKGDATIKELSSLREIWHLLNQRDEIYDGGALSDLRSLLHCMDRVSNNKSEERTLANEYKEKIKEKLGMDCEQYLRALEIVCDTYEFDDAENIPLLEERLALEEKIYGKEDYRTQATSRLLSSSLSQNHRLSQSIAVTQSSIKDDDYLSLLTLASNQSRYGQLRESNNTYERLLAIGEGNPNIMGKVGFGAIMGSINNYISLNDIDGLLDFGKRWSTNPNMSFDDQLTIFCNVIGMASLPGYSKDRVVAFADEFLIKHAQQITDINVMTKVLESKSSALYGMLRFDDAESVINNIVSIQTSLPSANNVEIARYYSYLEGVLIAKGDFQKALIANKTTIDLLRNIPGYETSVEYCSSLVRACLCYDQLGMYSEIIPLSDILCSMEEINKTTLNPLSVFSMNNFMVYNMLSDLGSIVAPLIHAYCQKGMFEQATSFIISYVKKLESTIKYTLLQLDVDKSFTQYGYIKTTADNLYLVASSQPNSQLLAKTVFDYCLLSKQAFLVSESQMRKQILESGDNVLSEKFQTVQSLRNSIQTYIQSGLDISILQEQLKQLEIQIREDSQIYGDFTKLLDLRWTDIQSALDDKSATIEFVSYPDYNDNKKHLSAIVLQKEWGAPQIIPLCSEDLLLDEDILNGKSIYDYIWEPILKKLNKNTNRLYFSPDGVIYNLSVENARYGDGFLSDRYKIIRLSSSRELVKSKTSVGSEALLCGGIVYYLTEEEMLASTNSKIDTAENFSRYVPREAISEIPYLPGTKVEVESINTTLEKGSDMKINIFTGKKAVEKCIKSINPLTIRILHIATHGFYEKRPVTESNIIVNLLQTGAEDKIMNRSGLYMAGAQNTYEGDSIPNMVDDGILTAQEISALDLRGLDLVTLSACETAKGDITGDGVFGLQRGFKKAGVNSILMSLWQVDDNATCKLMTEFYSNWISKKMSKYDALESAKKSVRNTKGWEDPKYWAAFILLDALD